MPRAGRGFGASADIARRLDCSSRARAAEPSGRALHRKGWVCRGKHPMPPGGLEPPTRCLEGGAARRQTTSDSRASGVRLVRAEDAARPIRSASGRSGAAVRDRGWAKDRPGPGSLLVTGREDSLLVGARPRPLLRARNPRRRAAASSRSGSSAGRTRRISAGRLSARAQAHCGALRTAQVPWSSSRR